MLVVRIRGDTRGWAFTLNYKEASSTNREHTRILLSQDEIPRNYVNILPYLRSPLPPPLDPKTSQPVDVSVLKRIFAAECVRQEMTMQKSVPIPEEVREAYLYYGRPTPLQRAVRLERALKTPARIYYKREDVSPTGSHKLNTALAQAYYAQQEGASRLALETGAGQWGSAVAIAAAHFGLSARVYMVRTSYEQKPYRRVLMRMYGAEVIPSPSDRTEYGRRLLRETPDHPGSLGVAISEALEDTLSREDTKYTNGSVLNYVLLHQTVIGQEAIAQLDMIDEQVDVVVACVGGGSNFGGTVFPLMTQERFRDVTFLAVEPEACPSMTKGTYRYDYGDTAGLTPMLKMYTLGADYIPPPIYAGGLRYHGVSPIVSRLVYEQRVRPVAYDQNSILDAGLMFARYEGIVPAPESAHTIRAVIDCAIQARRTDQRPVILFTLSGHGHFDMAAYELILQESINGTPVMSGPQKML